MLSYIVFCCGLLYVQAQTNCKVNEIIRNTNKLLEDNFGTCDCSHTNSCLCLPTSWNGCELSCFVDGFQRMKETLKDDNRLKKRIHQSFQINHILQSLQILQNVQCTNLLSCSEPCDPTSTGNIKDFLTVVKTSFQQVRKEKGGKK